MKKIVEWILPIKTISEANSREHWAVRRKRHQMQKNHIDWAFVNSKPNIPEKCHIHMTRISPGQLDYVNLVSSFKNIQDYIAACVYPNRVVFAKSKKGRIYSNPGHCDRGDSITWGFAQEKGKPKEYGVKISIYDMPMPIFDPRND
jgi:hypothetical protein